jgi:hypothetical protein
MWYKLNEVLGSIVLVVVLGGAAIYGLILVIEAPPLIRQESEGPSPQQLQARKDLERKMGELQRQQSDAIDDATSLGRDATN